MQAKPVIVIRLPKKGKENYLKLARMFELDKNTIYFCGVLCKQAMF